MNFDRNTVIGFIILAILFFGMFYYNNREQAAQLREKARQDSLARLRQPIAKDTTANNARVQVDTAGGFQQAPATETITIAETDLLKIGFSNKGGQPKWVELKKFKAPDSSIARLSSTGFDRISYAIVGGPNNTIQSADQYFTG